MKFSSIALLLMFMASAPVQAQNNPQYLAYIEQYKNLAIEQMQKYQIPASITLAQGLFESNAGKSDLARMSNNHFGIKCGSGWTGRTVRHDDDARGECFRSYDKVVDSYEDHSKFLKYRARYAQLFNLDVRDYKGWAVGLKKAGYATNPQYANRLINIIEQYKLYKYDDVKYLPEINAPKNEQAQNDHNQKYNGGNHNVFQCNNTPYIIIRNGDDLKKISREFRITQKKLIAYNELYTGYVLQENARLYLNKKRKHASDEDGYIYVVKEGESMHDIAQKLGIRLKNLYKLNKKSVGDSPLEVGTILRIH